MGRPTGSGKKKNVFFPFIQEDVFSVKSKRILTLLLSGNRMEPTNPTQHYKPRSHNAGTPTSRSVVSRDGIVIEENIQNELFIDRNVQRHQRASLDRQQKAKSLLDSLRGVDTDRQPTVVVIFLLQRADNLVDQTVCILVDKVVYKIHHQDHHWPHQEIPPVLQRKNHPQETSPRIEVTNYLCLSHILTPEI